MDTYGLMRQQGQPMQEQPIYQSVPVSQDEIYAGEIQKEIVKNIVAQISPDNQLYEIEMRIRGYRKDIETGMWVKRDNSVEPHPILIDRLMCYLGSIMNQNTSLSNLSERQINKIMAQTIAWLVDDLDSNSAEYGLSGEYTERTRIGHLILNPLFMVLNRALNGMESRRVWKSISLAESSNFGMPQQKKGIVPDWMKFWK